MFRKVLWAVDVRKSWDSMQETAARALDFLAANERPEVEFVYVADSSSAAHGAGGLFHGRLRTVIAEGHSTAHHARALSKYASDARADLIIVGTRGRGGLQRALQGSFAENLLVDSPVSLLTLGPEVGQRSLRFPSRILFPTHFGAASKRVFKKAVVLALDLGVPMMIYHWISNPVESIIQSGALLFGGPFPLLTSTESETEIEREHMRKRAEYWAQWARGQGVGAGFMVDPRGGDLARSIIDVAQRKDLCLILLEASPSPVVHQLMRQSDCPVLLLKQVKQDSGSVASRAA